MKDFRKTTDWRRARNTALRLSDGICYLCGMPVDFAIKKGPYSKQVDHIMPASRGGDLYDQENLRVTHKQCNQIKSANSIESMVVQRAIKLQREANEKIHSSGIDWLDEEDENDRDKETKSTSKEEC